MNKPISLSARAYEQLREAILSGEIQPGQALFENHLTAALDMSRTPIREALQGLARDGYLQELPDRGYTVPRPSLDDLREFFELREVLEAAAARYAALRAHADEVAELQRLCERYQDEADLARWHELGARFHALIVQSARNRRLAGRLTELTVQIDLSRRSVIYAGPAWRDTAVQDHRAICEAIACRDEAAAQQAAALHVQHSYQATLRAYQPEAFARQKTA
ncbi:GntR family transcriptional regulator [Pseudorhodoferax sp.]|uniref:GntR family transcriptional regulator n=1 Tax=Pseudorhodoferax sp. TaxID=1993553 RepID=UPI002DD699A0|nr:GntR family transcriptional regulator [Pseudorhodoferax sp.]